MEGCKMGLRAHSDAYRSDVANKDVAQRIRSAMLPTVDSRPDNKSNVPNARYELRPVTQRAPQNNLKYRIKHAGLLLLFVVVSIGLIRSFLFETFYIPSTSMAPFLEKDDHILVSKLAYSVPHFWSQSNSKANSSPARGDVVVFKPTDDPATQEDESARAMVKRVVGVAGDVVAIQGDEIRVLSSVSVRMAQKLRAVSKHGAQRRLFAVPEDSLFVVGDNRDVSYDSRFWTQPYVPLSQVVGKVALVY
jgi:signal peptidase I